MNIIFLHEEDNNGIIITGYYITDNSITKLYIPNLIDGKTVYAIGDEAFYAYEYLEEITIPNSVYKIGKFSFGNISATIIFENNSLLTTLDQYAFGAYRGEILSLPNSIQIIKSNAIYYATEITNLIIPNSVIKIEESAFGNLSKLNSITIPFVGSDRDGLNSTELAYMFNEMPYTLFNVTVSDAWQIGESAFSNSRNVRQVYLSEKVEQISSRAFYDSHYALFVYVDPENQYYSSETNGSFSILYDKNKTKIIMYHSRVNKSIIIPSTVITIGEFSFSNSESQIMFEANSQLQNIEPYAFYNFSIGLERGIVFLTH